MIVIQSRQMVWFIDILDRNEVQIVEESVKKWNPIQHASISFVFIDEWTLWTPMKNDRINEWMSETIARTQTTHTHTHLQLQSTSISFFVERLHAIRISIDIFFACLINMNARQVCAAIDFMCFNWLNVYRRRRRSRSRCFFCFLHSFALLCAFVHYVCVFEIALFYFLREFCLIFSRSLCLSVGEPGFGSTRLYRLANA